MLYKKFPLSLYLSKILIDFSLKFILIVGLGIGSAFLAFAQEVKTIEYWEKLVADNPNKAQAWFNIAVLYELGQGGVERDLDKAEKLHMKAVALNFAPASFNIGAIYAQRKDYQNAIKWWEKAARQSVPEAQYNLAWLYEKGIGVDQNSQMAVKLYEQSAQTAMNKYFRLFQGSRNKAGTVPEFQAGSGWAWVTKQPQENYTIQLSASEEQDKALKFIQQYALKDRAKVIPAISKGSKNFKVILGSFKEWNEAAQEIDGLAQDLRDRKPRVRSFASLTLEMPERAKLQSQEQDLSKTPSQQLASVEEKDNIQLEEVVASAAEIEQVGSKVQETPAQEAPAQETPVQETPAQETPAQETPAQETPAQETPVQETPVQETPAQETPAQETPAQEAPAQEAPVQEAPAQEAPAQEAPVQEAPAQEAPVQETPVQETPVQETPAQEGVFGPIVAEPIIENDKLMIIMEQLASTDKTQASTGERVIENTNDIYNNYTLGQGASKGLDETTRADLETTADFAAPVQPVDVETAGDEQVASVAEPKQAESETQEMQAKAQTQSILESEPSIDVETASVKENSDIYNPYTLKQLGSKGLDETSRADLETALSAIEMKNYALAFGLFDGLAKKGLPEALYRLAWLYSDGLGVEKDDSKAFKLARLAAEQGHPYSQKLLAGFYLNGSGVKKSRSLAEYWRQASEEENTNDIYNAYTLEQGTSKGLDETTRADLETTIDSATPVQLVNDLDWDWILRQPQENYTIQLSVSEEQDKALKFIQQYALKDRVKVIPAISKGSKNFKVILGSFKEWNEAAQAIGGLAQDLRDRKPPWIRNFASLTLEMPERVKLQLQKQDLSKYSAQEPVDVETAGDEQVASVAEPKQAESETQEMQAKAQTQSILESEPSIDVETASVKENSDIYNPYTLKQLGSKGLDETSRADLETALSAIEMKNYALAFGLFDGLAKKGLPEALYRLAWLYSDGLGVEKDDSKAFKLARLAAEQGHPYSQKLLAGFYLNGSGVKKSRSLAEYWRQTSEDNIKKPNQ